MLFALPCFYVYKIIQKHIKVLSKIYYYASLIYLSLLTLCFSILCFVKYQWYKTFNDSINALIFEAAHDNTKEIGRIIWNDYPVITIFVCSVICVLLTYWLNRRIYLKTFRFSVKIEGVYKLLLVMLFNIALIYGYTALLRGGFGQYGIATIMTKSFSRVSTINIIALNPTLSLKWTIQFHLETQIKKLAPTTKEEGELLQKELFSIYQISPKNEIASKNPPHIVLNSMESFGSLPLTFNDGKNNFLGSLKKHFRDDFTFMRFISADDLTFKTIGQLIFNSPYDSVIREETNLLDKTLKDTSLDPYKKLGYKIIYVCGCDKQWAGFGTALQKLNLADGFIDRKFLIQKYNITNPANDYFVHDEYNYKAIYDLLRDAKEKLFIINLTSSNHAPYDSAFSSIKLEGFKEGVQQRGINPSDSSRLEPTMKAYIYANNAFSSFLDKIKDDKNLRESVIVAAVGDHRQRGNFNLNRHEKALAYAVPFYLYIPKYLQNNLYYDKNRVGSHKDIFPTLYALSTSEVEYLSIGGRSLLHTPTNPKLEFGMNVNVWVDNEGVYPLNSSVGYGYESSNSLLDNDTPFSLDDYKRQFMENYKNLNDWQIRYRLKPLN